MRYLIILLRTAKLWSTETGKCYHTFKGHTAEIVCVTFNSSSTLVATGSMDTMGKIWDVETGVEMASLQVSPGHLSRAFTS